MAKRLGVAAALALLALPLTALAENICIGKTMVKLEKAPNPEYRIDGDRIKDKKVLKERNKAVNELMKADGLRSFRLQRRSGGRGFPHRNDCHRRCHSGRW